MTRTITFGLVAAATAIALWLSQSGLHRKPALVHEAAATVATPEISRREHLARLVAETAAANAEKTARSVLARRSARQETAAR